MIKVDGGNTAFFAYNAAGFRVEQGAGSTDDVEYVFDLSGNQVATVQPGTNTLWYTDLFDNGRHWVTFNGDAQFLHTDWVGTVRAVTSLSGVTNQQCTGLPFGDDLSCTSSITQYMGLSGTFLDGYDNLDHFPYRQYTPTEGRWVTPDPAGLAAVDPTNPQTWNRYAYVTNNPVSFTDPLGLEVEGGGSGTSGGEDVGGPGGLGDGGGCGGFTDGAGSSGVTCGDFTFFLPTIPTTGRIPGPVGPSQPPGGGGGNFVSGVSGNGTPDSPYTISVLVIAPPVPWIAPSIPWLVGWGVRIGSWIDVAAGILPALLLSQVGDANPPGSKEVICNNVGEFKDPSVDPTHKICYYSCSDGIGRNIPWPVTNACPAIQKGPWGRPWGP